MCLIQFYRQIHEKNHNEFFFKNEDLQNEDEYLENSRSWPKSDLGRAWPEDWAGDWG